jgi:hypothetical protein
MKQKELKNLAKKIAKLELTMQATDDPSVIADCETQIMYLTGRVTSFEDIDALDEMIQEILQNS